jgi:hypothetical protein
VSDDYITHGGTDRGYKNCKCFKCGIVARCTPLFDFYTVDNDSTGPLFCEVCFSHYCTQTLQKKRAMA